MKNRSILTKIITLSASSILVMSVTFFITATWVKAASTWQGPSQPPPDGNPAGFIQASPSSAQEAWININDRAEVGDLIIKPSGSFVLGSANPIGSWPDLCTEISPSVCTNWGELGSNLWQKAGGTGPDIYYNAGDIGIGTGEPGDDLQGRKNVHIYSPNGSRLILDGAGNSSLDAAFLDFVTLGDGKKIVNNAATKGWNFMAYGNSYQTPSLQNDLRIRYYNGAASTDVIHLTDNGNVGIGMTSPNYRLTISGSGAVGLDNRGYLAAKNNAGTYESFLWPRGSDNATYLNYGASGFNIRNNSSVSAMFMNNAGNIGIGTLSPDIKLLVGDGSNSNGNIIGVNGVDTTYTGYRLQTGGTEKWFIGMDSTASNNDLIFRRNSGGNDLIIKNDTGNIGINTATLDSHNKVTISAANAGIEITAPAGTYTGGLVTDPAYGNRAGHFKLVGTYGSEVYLASSPYIYNSSYGVYSLGYTAGVYGEGRSGVGVEGKGSYIGVRGETNNGGTGVLGTINSYFDEGGGWSGGYGTVGEGFGNKSVGVYGLADRYCINWVDNGSGEYICSDYADYSQSGIAIFGQGNNGAIGIKGNSDTGWAGYFKATAASPSYKGVYIDKLCLGTETNCKTGWSSGFWVQQSGTNNIYYNNGGNVGIGTADPKSMLHIKGNAAGSILIEANPASGDASPRLGFIDISVSPQGVATSPVWYIDNLSDEFRILRQQNISTSGKSFFTISNFGNVGIGATNQDVKLTVGNGLSGAGNIIGVNGVDTTYTGYRLQTGGTEKWFIGMDSTASNNDLIFRRNSGGNDLIIKNDTGNIGIGALSPTQKLEVNGNIRASGYYSGDGSAGLTRTINVRKSDNSGPCAITVKNGLITATTCP